MALQNLVQPIDILVPLSRPAMHDLGEIANRRLSQLQQLLPFQIALAAFPETAATIAARCSGNEELS